jgi:predicted ester cyclase
MTAVLTTEQKKAAYSRFLDILSSGNLSLLGEVLDLDRYQEICVGVTPGWVGIEAAKRSFAGIISAIPGSQMRIDDLLVDGDVIAARLTTIGTNTGSLFGTPPSGQKIEFETADIAWFNNGKIVRRWILPDLLTLMRQAGMVPFLNQAMGGEKTLPPTTLPVPVSSSLDSP